MSNGFADAGRRGQNSVKTAAIRRPADKGARRRMDEQAQAPLDLSGPEVWRDPRYHTIILEGLRRDGLGADAIEPVRMAFAEGAIGSNEDLYEAIDRIASGMPAARRDAAAAVLRHLRGVAAVNAASYRIATAEDARTVHWPNARDVLERDSEAYVDIHADLFYRTCHAFITRSTPIGSAGSCFAKRIAQHLQMWGYNYVIEEDDLPEGYPLESLTDTEYRMAPARMGTLFNVQSMLQMVERAFGSRRPDMLISTHSDGAWLDPFRYVRSRYSDTRGYVDDYERHSRALNRALLRCEVFVFTLGLTEAWYFAHSGDYTSVTPCNRINPLLLRMKTLSVEENVAALESMYELYRSHRPDIKFIISVSPIPLRRTFSKDHHIVVANNLSKATLVVAAHRFVDRHPGRAYYFPAYEMVMYGAKDPWEADRRHVTKDAVSRVMSLFRAMFLAE